MRLKKTMISAARSALPFAIGAMLAVLPGTASAGSRLKERVYDDSFGNLIIISPSGYKRIVVGMGHLAAEYESADRPRVVYLERRNRKVDLRHCYTPPVLWKGRSYMYGLADGEIPTPPRICD